jgi:hypothetical protein
MNGREDLKENNMKFNVYMWWQSGWITSHVKKKKLQEHSLRRNFPLIWVTFHRFRILIRCIILCFLKMLVDKYDKVKLCVRQ